MKKLKPTKRPNPYVRKIVVTLKVNSEEMRMLLAKAGAYTGGNTSEVIRAALVAFKPSKGDFQR